jgi:hypothetical protein
MAFSESQLRNALVFDSGLGWSKQHDEPKSIE